jgi:lauroyl/myristoyl acyltransferase
MLPSLIGVQSRLALLSMGRSRRRKLRAFFEQVRLRTGTHKPAKDLLLGHLKAEGLGRAALARAVRAQGTGDDPLLQVEGMDHVASCLLQGRGCVLGGLHLGAGALPAAYLVRQGIPVVTLRRLELKDKYDPDEVEPRFYGAEPRWISNDENPAALMKGCLKELSAGKIVSYLVDGSIGERGVVVDIFNTPVFMRSGALDLARLAKVPFFPAFGCVGKDRVTIKFHEPINLSGPEDVNEAMALVGNLYEEFVREYPTNCSRRHVDQYIFEGRKAAIHGPR